MRRNEKREFTFGEKGITVIDYLLADERVRLKIKGMKVERQVGNIFYC